MRTAAADPEHHEYLERRAFTEKVVADHLHQITYLEDFRVHHLFDDHFRVNCWKGGAIVASYFITVIDISPTTERVEPLLCDSRPKLDIRPTEDVPCAANRTSRSKRAPAKKT